MEVQQLRNALAVAGFAEEKLDTGYNYTKTVEHTEMICYIEPGIDIAFTTIYKWHSNEVKGTFIISLEELDRYKGSVPSLFKRTTADMPEYVGDKNNGGTDIHHEIVNAIDGIF